MTLIVEDGTGLSTAESYLSVADCSTYNTAHNAVVAWTSANEANQERALRNATQYLDAEWNGRWQGSRATTTQVLAWPRSSVEVDGLCLDSDTLPRALKDACAELAIRAVAGELMPDIEEPSEVILDRVKVGSIEVETGFESGRSQSPEIRIVDRLLRGLVYSNSEARRA